MLDLNFIRQHTEMAKAGLARRGQSFVDQIDLLLKIDGDLRTVTTEIQRLQAERNTISATAG